MKTIGKLSILAGGIMWRGFVLTKLWLWFVVSTFGVIALNLPQAIGVATIVSLLTRQYDEYTNENKSESERRIERILAALMLPAIALLIGWIATLFL